MKPRIRKGYNTNLGQLLYFCNKEEVTVERREQFDRIPLCFIQYVIYSLKQKGNGHVNEVPRALKFYVPGTKDKLYLSHYTMFDWARVKLSEHKTPRPHDPTLGIAYCLSRIRRYDMSLAVLHAFDSHLQVEKNWSLTKQRVIFETAPNTGVHLLVSRSTMEESQSVNVCFKAVKKLFLPTLDVFQQRGWPRIPLSRKYYGARIHKTARAVFIEGWVVRNNHVLLLRWRCITTRKNYYFSGRLYRCQANKVRSQSFLSQ